VRNVRQDLFGGPIHGLAARIIRIAEQRKKGNRADSDSAKAILPAAGALPSSPRLIPEIQRVERPPHYL
jgi:hypothetical protein